MSRFYFQLWLFWALRVVVLTLSFSVIVSLFITLFIYLKQGMPPLEKDVVAAVGELLRFWFVISLNFTLLLSLFMSIKYIFNRCYGGYKLQLAKCRQQKEFIEDIGYGDLIKVWRKWFMLLIWLVGAMMILALALTLTFTSYKSLFDWFGIGVLFVFILAAGYFSFIILAARCKQIRVGRC